MNSFSTVFKRRAITECAHTVSTKTMPVAAERLQIKGVENSGKSAIFLLYRGAQPRGEGYEELKKLGVSIVVDLRNSKPVKRDGGETREQVKIEAAGAVRRKSCERAPWPDTIAGRNVSTIAARQSKTKSLRALLLRRRSHPRDGRHISHRHGSLDVRRGLQRNAGVPLSQAPSLDGSFCEVFPGGICAQPGLSGAAVQAWSGVTRAAGLRNARSIHRRRGDRFLHNPEPVRGLD
jgi:hypothetical protein